MFNWLRDRRERDARDAIDANYVIKLHGDEALDVVRERADDEEVSERYRRRWRRVARLVERNLQDSG